MKNKNVYKFFVMLLLLFSLLSFLVLPNQVYAQLGLPYGGYDIVMIPCTCQGSTFFWHFFFPLYLSSIPSAGALVAPVTPLTYLNYYLRPGVWILGFYTPGAGVCTIGV